MESKEILIRNIARKNWGLVNITVKSQSGEINDETYQSLSLEDIYEKGPLVQRLKLIVDKDDKMEFEGYFGPVMASTIPSDSNNYTVGLPSEKYKCTITVERADHM